MLSSSSYRAGRSCCPLVARRPRQLRSCARRGFWLSDRTSFLDPLGLGSLAPRTSSGGPVDEFIDRRTATTIRGWVLTRIS